MQQEAQRDKEITVAQTKHDAQVAMEAAIVEIKATAEMEKAAEVRFWYARAARRDSKPLAR